jgi:anti-anti-sigma factor
MTVAQIWKSTRFTIECSPGKAAGTVLFRLTGPFTARDMYTCLSPDALRNTFESTPDTVQAAVHIFDLTQVPYLDSAGLGMMVSHYVRCQRQGIRLITAGVSPRVLQLLQLTKVGNLFPMTATLEEADRPVPSK